MKILKYNLCTCVNHGTEEEPEIEQVFLDKSLPYSEHSEEIAKKEAYNGAYTIENDGVEEISTPTTEERVEALEAAVVMLCMPDISEV